MWQRGVWGRILSRCEGEWVGESMGMWGAGGSSAGSGHRAIVLCPSLEPLARLPEGCRHAPRGLPVQAVTRSRLTSLSQNTGPSGRAHACMRGAGGRTFRGNVPSGGRGAQPAAGARRPHARPAPPGRRPAACPAGRGESEPRARRAVRSPAGPGLSRPPALPAAPPPRTASAKRGRSRSRGRGRGRSVRRSGGRDGGGQ